MLRMRQAKAPKADVKRCKEPRQLWLALAPLSALDLLLLVSRKRGSITTLLSSAQVSFLGVKQSIIDDGFGEIPIYLVMGSSGNMH